MGSSPSKPKASAEYLQYLEDYEYQNSGTKNYIRSEEHLKLLQNVGVVGEDYEPQYSIQKTGGDADPNDQKPYWLKDENYYYSGGEPGIYTGTDELDERGYYEDKYERQQQEYQDKLDQQMADQKAEMDAETERQRQELEDAQAENQRALEERAAEVALQEKTTKRDQILGDRATAANSAVDYVNQKVERERSNAALFGIDYELTDEQKNQRVSEYFSTIWNQEYEDQLGTLFDDIGTPEGFDGFAVNLSDGEPIERGVGGTTILGSSQGMNRPPPDELTGGPPEFASGVIPPELTGGPPEYASGGGEGWGRLTPPLSGGPPEYASGRGGWSNLQPPLSGGPVEYASGGGEGWGTVGPPLSGGPVEYASDVGSGSYGSVEGGDTLLTGKKLLKTIKVGSGWGKAKPGPTILTDGTKVN